MKGMMSRLDSVASKALTEGVKRWLLFFLMLAVPLVGQVLEDGIPRVPEGRILDEARLFALEPEILEELSVKISSISDRTGYEIYVAIFDSLIGSDVKEQSQWLQDAWVGDAPGAVLVLESDSSLFEIAWSRMPDAMSESGEKVPVLGSSDLAPQAQVIILNSILALRSDEKGSVLSAQTLIGTFADGIDAAFREGDEAQAARWNVRVLMLGTGLLAGMLLIGMLVGASIRRSDRKVADRLMFPRVTVGMRLGAQSGGGKISSRSFGVVPHEKA